MMRSLKMLGIAAIILLLSSCANQTQSQLTIALASNLQFVMEDLSKVFSQSTGVPCQTVISSSGKLTAQIQSGAPYDVLLSADMKYPAALHQAGLTLSAPRTYAFGQLVLWSMDKTIELSLSTLRQDGIDRIAIANPNTAPYGQAALSSLEFAGLKQVLEPKLIYGEAIAQVNQFIVTQAVDVGFTAKSVVLAPGQAGKGVWIDVPDTHYAPIAQGIVLLKNKSSKLPQAKKFQDFLFSPTAQQILTRYGYQISNS